MKKSKVKTSFGLNIAQIENAIVKYHHNTPSIIILGFLGGSVVKNPPANAEDTSLIPGSGRSSGGRNSNPLQYSCLENPIDRRTW